MNVWYSLAPLIVINVFMLALLVVYMCIGKTVVADKEVGERHASRFLNRWFRSYWVWLISPIERFFVRTRMSPNTITVLGVCLSVGAGGLYAVGEVGLAGWLVIFGGTCDMFDGRVARATGQVTKSGAYFDAVMDRYAEGLTYFGLLYLYRDHWMFCVVLVASLGAIMVSYSKARAEAMGLSLLGGSMQRPERIVYLGVPSVFSPILVHGLGAANPFPGEHLLLVVAMIFMALATHGSAISRIREAMRTLERR